MPPQRFVRPSSARSTPLPKGRYGIASTLPPTFGVHELYDWFPKDSTSSSTRSVSAGFSTFQRHWQKAYGSVIVRDPKILIEHSSKPSPSVSAWVRDQKSNSLLRGDTLSDGLSSAASITFESPLFASTPNGERTLFSSSPVKERPLFAPIASSPQLGFGSTQSPTPAKHKPSLLPSQPPIVGSRSKPNPKNHSPSVWSGPNIPRYTSPENPPPANTLDLISPSIAAQTASSAVSSRRTGEYNQQSAADVGDYSLKDWGYEGYNASDDVGTDAETSSQEEMSELTFNRNEADSRLEGEDSADSESEDQSDEESEDESKVGGKVRMRASRYIDFEAREARETKPNHKAWAQHTTDSVGDRWLGGSQGLMSFRKRPNEVEATAPGKWSFSNDGAARQPLKDREAGDVHFSPAYSGGSGDDYWMVVDSPKRRWVSCAEGQAHPTLAGYVLRPRAGTKPPQWVRTQSLRANKWRGRVTS
ncbi:hypothetical protein FRC12_009838 [Ceratobasidium sp. 428]|nr:hypothetical protein FRC12_009838 [Ceratobasidium sp. 428]